MSIQFTLNSFPLNADVKDAAGLPWGCVIQPLVDIPANLSLDLPASALDRCESCNAYVSHLCQFGRQSWKCGLCLKQNKLSERYDTGDRSGLPELRHEMLEYDLDDGSFGHQMQGSRSTDDGVTDCPSYIFAMDLNGSEETVELLKSAVLAAVEALPANVRVGLLVFSNKIGVYNLHSSAPLVSYTFIKQTGLADLSLGQLLTLPDFLANMGDCKDNLCTAVESVRSFGGSHHEEAANTKGGAGEKRAFGTVVHALMEYLLGYSDALVDASLASLSLDHVAASAEAAGALAIRVLCFLTGLPNMGLGNLSGAQKGADVPGGDAVAGTTSPTASGASTGFYQEQARLAARSGVCFDLFVISDLQRVQLVELKHLTVMTGGNLMLYESTDQSTLPEDCFRQLQAKQGFRCLLRVRCSPEYHVSTVYGHCVPDLTYEGLFHLAGCDNRKTFAGDLAFLSGTGFDSYAVTKPGMQMAFAFTCMRANAEGVLIPARRLRVLSVRAQVAKETTRLYQDSNAEAILCQLMQQCIQAAVERGVQETRLLVKDWLINLTAFFHKNVHGVKNKENLTAKDVDACFQACPALQFIPRFIFGLLKSPLLTLDSINHDLRVYLHCLFSGLELNYLAKAVYPSLTPFKDCDVSVDQSLHLSAEVIQASPYPIFLMDTYTALYVYYRHPAPLSTNNSQNNISESNSEVTAAAPPPFPPPQQSELRAQLKKIRLANPLISPRVVIARQGTADGRYFETHLMEDQMSGGFDFDQFFASVEQGAVEILKE